MPLLSEIIYTTKDLPRQGDGESRSNNYTDRQLAFIINYYRAKIINQKLERARSNQYLQTLGKVEVIKASKNECCEYGPIDCVFRTKEKLPSFLTFKDDILVSYVGTVDGLKPYTQSSYNMTGLVKYAPYTSTRTRWYWSNNYIYIVNPPNQALKYISVSGVFEKPEEANNFYTCGCIESEADCAQGFDFEYPIAASDIDVIIKMIVEAEYKMAYILPKDTLNDSRDAN